MIRPRVVAVAVDGPIFKVVRKGVPGVDVYGPRVPGVVRALRWLQSKGYEIVIYSTRNNPIVYKDAPANLPEVALSLALHKARIPYNNIADFKPLADFYIESKAIRFHDWGKTLRFIGGAEKKKPRRRPR